MNKIQMTPLQLVIKAYNWVGYKYTEQDAEFMVNALTNLLNSSWKRYKIKEVDYFITLGLNGVFGNFAGISMATICQFETSYQKTDNLYYRKEYLRLNPPEILQELVSYTESHKEEVVKKSIIDKINSKSCKETDYATWFDFLVVKGNAWKKYIYNSEDDYDPAKERLLIHLRNRKEVAANLRQFHLIDGIMNDIENTEKDNPNIEDIKYWCKVLFFEDIINNETKREYLINELSK